MKKIKRLIMTIFAVSFIVIGLNLFTEGIPLLGIPEIGKINRVVIEHKDYPDECKTYSDEENIELAVALLGYLRYSPLKGLSDDNQLIKITYIMDDGTEQVVAANNYTVWWNGKPSVLHDENTFVKMCTAVFFGEN